MRNVDVFAYPAKRYSITTKSKPSASTKKPRRRPSLLEVSEIFSRTISKTKNSGHPSKSFNYCRPHLLAALPIKTMGPGAFTRIWQSNQHRRRRLSQLNKHPHRVIRPLNRLRIKVSRRVSRQTSYTSRPSSWVQSFELVLMRQLLMID